MAEDQGNPGQGGGGGIIGSAKGILQSISQGVRELLVLEERFSSLNKESDRSRKSIEDLQAIAARVLATLSEMDKRSAETDKRVQLQIELSQGARRLIALEEKLAALSKEDDRSRKSIEDLQAIAARVLGILSEMDKRSAETDKRIQLQIESAVRNALDKRNDRKELGA